MVEVTMEVPSNTLAEYKKWQAERFPTIRIIKEGSNIDDLTIRASAILSRVDKDKVRVVDLYVVPKSATFAPGQKSKIEALTPDPPIIWSEFYNSLPQRDKSVFASILRPLVVHKKMGNQKLSELNGQTIELGRPNRPAQELASRVFGLTLASY